MTRVQGAMGIALAALASAATAAPRLDTPVRIEFRAGEPCFTYSGRASAFSGVFVAGQRLVISSTGEAHFGDPQGGRWIKTQAREIDVSSASGAAPVTADDGGEWVVPATGRYSVTVWPHAIQGYPGVMIVCRR